MASTPPMVALDSLDEQRQGLRIEFRWRNDRYIHTVYRVADDTAVPYYSSLEGTEDELFPASPCLFDLHQQDQVLFLTGATSACHWSLSIQAALDGSLVFEVACRFKAEPSWLGSTYETLHPGPKEMLSSDSNLRSCESTQQIRISPTAELPREFPTTLQWNYRVNP
ncbi:hypothetical protein [Bythopirellula goksoeyrii]|uniref:Uncharacterized protein n=1 Tax=Bythopirellula goksoeyrii TaxID=1400387 RepID=A0A5B9QV31_9BACT|nr:hypothetical protein [Bythopirellula goksoeyrii]QEG37861.1 hypothetical protein Pr1d_52090 [Bythopirellula goksoeyrii]